MKKIISLLFALTPISVAQDYWQLIGTFTDASVSEISFAHNGDIFVGTGFEGSSFSNGGIYRSTDNGEHWIKTPYAGRNVKTIAINSNDYVFVGTSDGVLRSTDYGDSWIKKNYHLYNPYIESLNINSNDYIFAGTQEGIYISTDDGESWIGHGNILFWSLTVTSNNHIFAGSDFYGIWRSTDNGANWIKVSYINYTNVWTLTSYSSNIFAGTQNGLFRSTNNGGTWAYPSILQKDIWSLAINSNGHIFAGTGQNGVYQSTDNGDTWTTKNSGLADLGIGMLETNSNDYVFVEQGSKLFRSTNPTVSIEDKEKFIPRELSLYQNYPNPFNPSTTISYSIPKTDFVSLKVYDVLGNEIATVVNEEKSQGNYSVKFDASNLASGIYFCTIRAGNFLKTNKMILAK